jgi:hypothetical protein
VICSAIRSATRLKIDANLDHMLRGITHGHLPNMETSACAGSAVTCWSTERCSSSSCVCTCSPVTCPSRTRMMCSRISPSRYTRGSRPRAMRSASLNSRSAWYHFLLCVPCNAQCQCRSVRTSPSLPPPTLLCCASLSALVANPVYCCTVTWFSSVARRATRPCHSSVLHEVLASDK